MLTGSRSALSKHEKLNYIDAVKCLHAKPALTPSAIAGGAKSRFDDFIVTHVKQTKWVHGTVRLARLCVVLCKLTSGRPTSSLGTVTISGPTSSSCVTNAATRVTSRITIGGGGPKILRSPLSLMEVRPVLGVTAHTSLGGTTLALDKSHPASSSSTLAKAEVVLRAVLWPSKLSPQSTTNEKTD